MPSILGFHMSRPFFSQSFSPVPYFRPLFLRFPLSLFRLSFVCSDPARSGPQAGGGGNTSGGPGFPIRGFKVTFSLTGDIRHSGVGASGGRNRSDCCCCDDRCQAWWYLLYLFSHGPALSSVLLCLFPDAFFFSCAGFLVVLFSRLFSCACFLACVLVLCLFSCAFLLCLLYWAGYVS